MMPRIPDPSPPHRPYMRSHQVNTSCSMDMSLLAGLPPIPVIREPVIDAESASSREAAEERDMDDRYVMFVTSLSGT